MDKSRCNASSIVSEDLIDVELPEITLPLTCDKAMVSLYTVPILSKLELKLKCPSGMLLLSLIPQCVAGPIMFIHTKTTLLEKHNSSSLWSFISSRVFEPVGSK